MESNVDRYRTIIESCAKICQLRKEIEDLQRNVRSNITLSELEGYAIDSDSVNIAFKSMGDNFSLQEEDYVKSSLIYKQVRIYLHDYKNDVSDTAFNKVLKEAGFTR